MPDTGKWRQSRQEEPHPRTRDQDVRRKVGHHIQTSGGRGTEYQFPSWEKTNEGGQMVGTGRRRLCSSEDATWRRSRQRGDRAPREEDERSQSHLGWSRGRRCTPVEPLRSVMWWHVERGDKPPKLRLGGLGPKGRI
jgi:hypothetical protein